jgi:predicted ATPase/DNA-binding SARP family transcriptional activator
VLEIFTFGGLTIRQDGSLKTGFRQRKEEALLVYLACTRSTQPRKVLAELLWPDRFQAQALGNLRVVITGLRQHMPSYLTITRQTIAFNTASPNWLDAEELEKHLADTNQRWRHEARLSIETAGGLEQALALYTGDFLAGFSVRECQGFEDWLLLERDRYRQYVINALQRLVTVYSAEGNYSAGIVHLTRLVQLDPFLEEAHRQLMKLYEWTGQRGAALKQFELYQRLLEQELRIQPESETAALNERIRAGTLAAPTPGATGNVQVKAVSNLPHQITPFVGRAAELETLAGYLNDPNARLITLLGPGGSGKTRLALQAAFRADCFYQGAYFVSLAALHSPALLTSAIASALQFSFSGSEAQETQLLNYLREKEILLVMDNYEHLLPEIALVINILETAPSVKILVTSRVRLNLVGETIFHIDGMDYPEDALVGSPGDYGAVKLFLQTARRVQPHLLLDQENLLYVTHICQRTQGMPLAILLAAGWLDTLSLPEISHEIGQNFDFLQATQRDLPDRQRSMRVVFEHSWNLLSQEERTLFATLSVFRGGFTWQAAQAVAQASRHTLVALINKSMLRRDTNGRYEVHELLRQYGTEKLRETGQQAAVEDKHCCYFACFMKEREAHLLAASQLRAMAEIELDLYNVRLAWRQAYMRGWQSEIHQLVYTLGCFYTLRGINKESGALFREAVDYMEAHEPTAAQSLKVGLILPWLGWIYIREGDVQTSRDLLNRGIAILRQHNLPFETAIALWFLSTATEHAESNRYLAECLEIFTALDAAIWIAGSLFRMGWNAFNGGDTARADELIQQAIAISRPIGHRDLLAWGLEWQADRAVDNKNYALAERNYEEMVVLYTELRFPGGVASGLVGLGICAYLQGNYSLAQTRFREALALDRDTGAHPEIARLLIWLAFPTAALGNQREAAGYYRAGLLWCANKSVTYPTLLGLTGAAQLIGMMHRPADAVKLLWFSLNHPGYLPDHRKLAQAFLDELEGQMTPAAFTIAKASSQELTFDAAISSALQECETIESGT